MPHTPSPGHGSGRAIPLHLNPRALSLVLVGGIAGTLARYGLSLAIPTEDGFPLAILTINVVGALLLGVLLEALVLRGPDVGWARRLRLLIGTGFLGAFTTYSTFALDGVHLLMAGRTAEALLYVAATLVLGGCATALGVWIASRFHHRRRREVT